jgi:hypothetical protein
MHAAIVVPTTAHNYDDAVQMAVKELAERYGEVHTVDMRKWYTNRDGDLESEPATKVETYGPVHREGGITMVAERVREITGLRGVMYIIDGERTVV